MSNHLAIATVTATLRQVLHNAVTQDISGASVEILPLNDTRLRDTQPILNVFLYHVAPNAAWRNEELPTRREDGTISQRPRLALNLYYLLTAYGRATQTDPESHRLLGSAVRRLHERPVLSRADIGGVVASHPALNDSNLADQIDLIRLTPQSLALEELSKLWSVFFQTPYRISASYEASVVLIDAEADAQPSLPVQVRNVYVVTLRAPVVERVAASSGPLDPIHPEQEILITGANLRGDATLVRVGGLELTPDPDTVADDRIAIDLPPGLEAGLVGVQVIHQIPMGTPEVPHRGSESNLAGFVLRPRIRRNAADTDWDVDVDVDSGAGTDTREGEITVRIEPEVTRRQRVTLLLNRLGAPVTIGPRAFSFDADSRRDDPAERTEVITVPFNGVPAGSYLVRVQVDGAESPVVAGGDGTFDQPSLTVP